MLPAVTVTQDIACCRMEYALTIVVAQMVMSEVFAETWNITRPVPNDVNFAIDDLSRENW